MKKLIGIISWLLSASIIILRVYGYRPTYSVVALIVMVLLFFTGYYYLVVPWRDKNWH